MAGLLLFYIAHITGFFPKQKFPLYSHHIQPHPKEGTWNLELETKLPRDDTGSIGTSDAGGFTSRNLG